MKKRLYKSSKDKMLFGTAAGIAEYFEIDPVFVRVLFVLLTIFHGSGILIYIVCSIVMPKDWKILNIENLSTTVENPETDIQQKKSNKERVIGIILIILGGVFFLDNFVPSFDFDDYFPLLLIVIGAWLLSVAFRKEKVAQ